MIRWNRFIWKQYTTVIYQWFIICVIDLWHLPTSHLVARAISVHLTTLALESHLSKSNRILPVVGFQERTLVKVFSSPTVFFRIRLWASSTILLSAIHKWGEQTPPAQTKVHLSPPHHLPFVKIKFDRVFFKSSLVKQYKPSIDAAYVGPRSLTSSEMLQSYLRASVFCVK